MSYWLECIERTPLKREVSKDSYYYDLLCKSVNWILYDRVLRHERVKKVPARNVSKSIQIVGIVAILTKCSKFMMLAVGKFLEIPINQAR